MTPTDVQVITFLLLCIAVFVLGILVALFLIAGSLSRLADKHGTPAKKEPNG